MADPVPPQYKSGTTTSGGGTSGSTGYKVINSLGTFKDALAVVGNWTSKTMNEILMGLTDKGYMIADSFYPQIQNSLYTLEQETGVAISDINQVPGALKIALDVLKETGGAGPAGGGSTSRTGTSGGSGGGSGYTGRDAAAQELDRAMAAYTAQRAALEREELAQRQKEALLQSATSLANQRVQERAEARRQRITIAGNDPFRLAASLQARPAGAGPTPYDALKAQVAGVSTQDIPQVGPQSTVQDLESSIAKMQAMNMEVTGNPLAGSGMAMGGSLTAKGPQFGGAGYGVLVGDREINGDEELVHIRPDGVTEVIPIVGHAAEGAVLPQSPQVLPRTFQNYDNLNLTVVPEQFASLRAGMYGQYGIASGYSSEPAKFGRGLGQITDLNFAQGLMEAGMTPEDANRMAQLIGTLPNPRNIGPVYQRMNPVDKMNIKSVYALAGIDPDTFEALAQSSLILGPERRALAIA